MQIYPYFQLQTEFFGDVSSKNHILSFLALPIIALKLRMVTWSWGYTCLRMKLLKIPVIYTGVSETNTSRSLGTSASRPLSGRWFNACSGPAIAESMKMYHGHCDLAVIHLLSRTQSNFSRYNSLLLIKMDKQCGFCLQGDTLTFLWNTILVGIRNVRW